MLNRDEYDILVSRIYQAATGVQPWNDVLQQVCDDLGGRFCQLVALDLRTGRMALTLHSTGSPVDGVLDYMREYHRSDPHIAHAATLPAGTVFNSKDLIPARVADQHPFYREFWSAHGLRYMSGGKVSEDEEMAVYMGVFRSAEQGPMQNEADAVLAGLFAHLRQAFSAWRRYCRLTAQADSGRLVVDQSPRPIVLLRPDRFVVHANAAANVLIHKAEVMVVRGGHLGCTAPHAEEALSRALSLLELENAPHATRQRPDRRTFALRDRSNRAVPACLWAWRPAETMAAFGDTARAMLMLPTTTEKAHPDPMLLAAGFDLTPAESRVLAHLARLADIRLAAQAAGISFHTARCHLRSIFDKTGLHSQKELLHHAQSMAYLG